MWTPWPGEGEILCTLCNCLLHTHQHVGGTRTHAHASSHGRRVGRMHAWRLAAWLWLAPYVREKTKRPSLDPQTEDGRSRASGACMHGIGLAHTHSSPGELSHSRRMHACKAATSQRRRRPLPDGESDEAPSCGRRPVRPLPRSSRTYLSVSAGG